MIDRYIIYPFSGPGYEDKLSICDTQSIWKWFDEFIDVKDEKFTKS